MVCRYDISYQDCTMNLTDWEWYDQKNWRKIVQWLTLSNCLIWLHFFIIVKCGERSKSHLKKFESILFSQQTNYSQYLLCHNVVQWCISTLCRELIRNKNIIFSSNLINTLDRKQHFPHPEKHFQKNISRNTSLNGSHWTNLAILVIVECLFVVMLTKKSKCCSYLM